ncbi:MAG: hypothetical protein MZV63_36205 [Marinilabiliales bacterium]|nr:hypothetical protein [Marinilabiliales bacterium]
MANMIQPTGRRGATTRVRTRGSSHGQRCDGAIPLLLTQRSRRTLDTRWPTAHSDRLAANHRMTAPNDHRGYITEQ